MNYRNHYESLISKAKVRNWSKKSAPVYVERHHIIPKCLGGDNSKENLIYLTYREHCLAHLFLTKIYPNNYKLLCAAKRMYSAGKFHRRYNSKNISENLRKQHALAASIFFKGKPKKPFTDEHKTKLSESHKGHKDTIETKKKKSESLKGKVVKEETKNKLRIARSRQTNGGDKKVSILGVEYKSIGEAERVTGVSRFNIWRRINSTKYPEYLYL